MGVVMDHVLAGNGDAHAVRRGSVPMENITGNERDDGLHVAQAGLVQGLAQAGWVQGLSQNLGAVILGVHLGNDLLDLALFVNHKGDTVGPHVFAAVHALLYPGCIGFVDAVVLVGQQIKG